MTHRTRIAAEDRLTVGGRVMALIEEGDIGYVFEAVDQPNVHISYTFAEFIELLKRPDVSLEPAFYASGRHDARKYAGIDLVSGLPEKPRSETVWRHANVMGFLHLERLGLAKRTDDSIRNVLPKLEAHVNALARSAQSKWKSPRAGRKNEFRDPPCPKSLRTWVNRYEKGGHSPLALVPRTHRCGNRNARFCPESLRFLSTAIDAYLSRRRLNRRQVYNEYRRSIDTENETRLAANTLPLKVMSKRGVERTINRLDPYFTYVQRHGVDAANRRHDAACCGRCI